MLNRALVLGWYQLFIRNPKEEYERCARRSERVRAGGQDS